MNADVVSAIRLGEKSWIYARHKLHFWDDGMPAPPCGVGVDWGHQEAADYFASEIVIEGREYNGRTVSDVIDLEKQVCTLCAEVWRGEG